MKIVYVIVTGTPSSAEDDAIPGIYEAEIKDTTESELIASAALDAFHESFGIDNLDDFTFMVVDENGVDLAELDDIECYTNGAGVTGVEKVDSQQVPEAVANLYQQD